MLARLALSVSILPLLIALGCGEPAAGGSTSTGGSSGEPASTGVDPVPTTTGTSTSTTGGSSTGEGVTGSTGGETGSTTGPAPTTGEELTGGTTTGGPTTFLIGVDVTDVSPDKAQLDGNDLYMGAYGAPYTRGPAQGVHDPIYARSFAYEAAGTGVIVSIVDLPGMGNQNTRLLRQKVAALTGLEEGQVLVGTTHTHSGPDLMGLWGGVGQGYRDQLIERTATSMAAAWEKRVPAELRVATGKAPNNNRRGWGFTDDDMIVLDAFDLEGGRLGTLVNFAAHPVILGEDNKLISCDYTGYTVKKLEAELGAPAAIFNGALGDATPKVPEGMYADDFERAQAYGELLAGVASELTASTEPVEPLVVWKHREWEQAVSNQLFQLASLLGILQYDFEMQGLDQKVTTQSSYVRLGTQVQMVAFPGEALTRCGLAIKDTMKAPHRMILGNTGDALGYFIPADEWQTGKNNNYEESVSLGKTAGDAARGEIVQMIAADNF